MVDLKEHLASDADTSGAMSKGWQERRQRVAANIERVALNLFSERGYHAVTIEDIADVLGCSIRTVTRHFPTKEDLLLSFHRRKNQTLLNEFNKVKPSQDPVSAIWAVWSNMAQQAKSDLPEYLQWMKVAVSAPDVMDRVNGERRRDLQEVLSVIIARSNGHDRDIDMRSRIIAAALEAANTSLVGYWIDRGGVDDFDDLYRAAANDLTQMSVTPCIDF